MNVKRIILTSLCACLLSGAVLMMSACNKGPETITESSVIPDAMSDEEAESTVSGVSEITESSSVSAEIPSGSSSSQISDVSDLSDTSDTQSNSGESSEKSQQASAGNETEEISSASDSDETGFTETEKKDIGKKTIEDFETGARKSNAEIKPEKTKLYTAIIDPMSRNNIHTRIRIYGVSEAGTLKSDTSMEMDIQKKDDKNLYEKYTISYSIISNTQEIVFVDGKGYILDSKKKTAMESDDAANPMSMLGDSLISDENILEETGTVKYDGKDLSYEKYNANESSGTAIIVYFDGEKFYKAEIYQNDSSNATVLLGYITVETDLPFDDSLIKIPTDYEIIKEPDTSSLIAGIIDGFENSDE